jgi:hypothetical protein
MLCCRYLISAIILIQSSVVVESASEDPPISETDFKLQRLTEARKVKYMITEGISDNNIIEVLSPSKTSWKVCHI